MSNIKEKEIEQKKDVKVESLSYKINPVSDGNTILLQFTKPTETLLMSTVDALLLKQKLTRVLEVSKTLREAKQ